MHERRNLILQGSHTVTRRGVGAHAHDITKKSVSATGKSSQMAAFWQ